jgi:hypothetical protein
MGLSKSSPICRLAVAVLALSLSARSSAIHGTRQKIEVHTDPPGALTMAEGQSVTTPGVLNLQRKLKDAAIRIEKEGYRPEVVRLDRSLSGALWWNLVLIPAGAAAGWAATPEESGLDHMFEREENGALAAVILPLIAFGGDFLVGGAYRLDPPYISITLVPLAVEPAPSNAVQRFDGMTTYRA